MTTRRWGAAALAFAGDFLSVFGCGHFKINMGRRPPGGTTDEQVTYMKKAAQELSQDAAADFLFLFPNLIVADQGINGLPKNAITESFDLSAISKG